jgi:D-3-phosphoglycerate dehydrogenase/microcystin synthetase protein McyI
MHSPTSSNPAAALKQPTVAFIGGIYHSDAAELLAARMHTRPLLTPSPDEIAQALSAAQAAIVRYPYKVDAAALRDADTLVAVASSGRGTDSIDIAACTERGVLVLNNPGFGTQSVSEHAMGLLLALAKRLFEGDAAVRAGGAWDRRTDLAVLDMYQRTLGIVGFGLIGRELARKCSIAFGMQVLAYDPYVDPDVAAASGARMVGTLDEVLEASDFVSLHCELNQETLGLIGEEQLRRMKPSAFLVNTARGKVVREAALVKALEERWIQGAALDVYENEPLSPDSPLHGLNRLILSPHVAGLSSDALWQLADSAARQLVQALDGVRPPNVVNPQAWEAAMAKREAFLRA